MTTTTITPHLVRGGELLVRTDAPSERNLVADFRPLAKRIDAFVRGFLPEGTSFSNPSDKWDGDSTVVYLHHPDSPTFKCALVLNADDGTESIYYTGQVALEDWFDQIVADPDLDSGTPMDDQQRELTVKRFRFARELAQSCRRVGEAIDELEAVEPAA